MNKEPMTTIRLADAAKYFKGMPHQLAAWNALEEALTPRQLQEFTDLYRISATPKASLFVPASSFQYRITADVTYGEFALQSESRRFIAQHQCETAKVLAAFIQKARDHFKHPAVVTSGYRPSRINSSVGGAPDSEHLYDVPNTGAVDFYIDGISVYTLQAWADKEWPYSLGYGAPKGFIHVGMRPGKPRVRWNY